MDHAQILWRVSLRSERPLKFASFKVERVACVRELAELPAGEDEFDEEVQEYVSLGFVLDFADIGECVVEKFRDSGREYFRAEILFYKTVMLGFEEESRQVLGLKLYRVVGDQGPADDDGSERDVVCDDLVSFGFAVQTDGPATHERIDKNSVRFLDRFENVLHKLSLAAEVTW